MYFIHSPLSGTKIFAKRQHYCTNLAIQLIKLISQWDYIQTYSFLPEHLLQHGDNAHHAVGVPVYSVCCATLCSIHNKTLLVLDWQTQETSKV